VNLDKGPLNAALRSPPRPCDQRRSSQLQQTENQGNMEAEVSNVSNSQIKPANYQCFKSVVSVHCSCCRAYFLCLNVNLTFVFCGAAVRRRAGFRQEGSGRAGGPRTVQAATKHEPPQTPTQPPNQVPPPRQEVRRWTSVPGPHSSGVLRKRKEVSLHLTAATTHTGQSNSVPAERSPCQQRSLQPQWTISACPRRTRTQLRKTRIAE